MIPGFDLGPVLGRGGAGTVHRAQQRSTGRPAAVKILDVDASAPQVSRAFDRERHVMSALASHPNVVSILDAGVAAGRPWIAMELHPGGSFAGAGALSVSETVAVVSGIAAALDAAHAQGVVHCDVKPANILRGDYGPALADFGIARFGLGTGHTGAAYTLDHAAPEVVAGARPTPASDVYSLGTTAYHLVSGRPPFRRADDASSAAVLARIAHDPLPPLGNPGLDRLLAAMTAKDPAARPTARDVRAAVESLSVGAVPDLPEAGHTDHRPDLAVLTRSVGSARLAAAPMSVADAAVPGRDRVVLVAVAALAVVVLGSGGLLGARLTAVEPVAAAAVPTTTSPTAPGAPPAVVAPSAPGAPEPSVAEPEARQAPASGRRPTAPGPAAAVVVPPRVAVPPVAVAPAPVVVPTTTTTTTDNGLNQDNGGGNGDRGGGDLFPNGF